ncbi:MAG: hypothetical protein IT463_07335 [Planctomycetes bacterium]|nr:hypothetical protein [Planctomycetota bacterium]
MGCLYLLCALLSPRLCLAAMWLLTPWVQPNAFTRWWVPLLGMIFLPWTTLAAVWGLNTEFGPLQIAAVVVGLFADVGTTSDAERRRRRQRDEK